MVLESTPLYDRLYSLLLPALRIVVAARATRAARATASTYYSLVRVEPRQPFIDEGPYGLLEGLRGQNLCLGQVEVPLDRRVKASHTLKELTQKVGKVTVRQGVAILPPSTANLALVDAFKFSVTGPLY